MYYCHSFLHLFKKSHCAGCLMLGREGLGRRIKETGELPTGARDFRRLSAAPWGKAYYTNHPLCAFSMNALGQSLASLWAGSAPHTSEKGGSESRGCGPVTPTAGLPAPHAPTVSTLTQWDPQRAGDVPAQDARKAVLGKGGPQPRRPGAPGQTSLPVGCVPWGIRHASLILSYFI